MRVLIVDDEELIANGILYIIHKIAADFVDADVAFSGEEALEKLSLNHYDLLLTDVYMQEMNGLELIASAKERNLCNIFCIISGYAEFEYARSAISLGVNEYLLKPIDKDKLLSVLKRAAESTRKNEYTERKSVEQKIDNLLFGNSSDEEDTKIDFSNYEEWGIIVAEDILKAAAELSYNNLSNLYKFELADYIITARHISAVVILGCPSKQMLLTEKLCSDFPTLSIGTSIGKIETSEDLWTYYKNSARASLYARYFFKTNVLSSDKLEFISYSNFFKYKSDFKKIHNIDIKESQVIQYQICAKKLDSKTSLEESILLAANPYVRQMQDLIESSFNQELTLEYASRRIGINSDYASKLFRAETGISFQESLNKFRIAKILDCIAQNPSLTFEQVAPSMGFADIRNFYRVFKRIVKLTPGEFKKRMLEK